MLPNKLVWNYEDCTDTYLANFGDKIMHILPYLASHLTMFGDCFFTIEDMITSSGLTPKSGAGKINSVFKDILVDLQWERIIVTDTDISSASITSFICCKFTMPIMKASKGKNTQFFPVAYSSYSAIMGYKGDLSKILLLKTFFYINARLSRREYQPYEEYVGGRANTFYDSYSAICKDLTMAEETWNLYINELKSLDLIYFDNVGLVRRAGNSQTANNVYCIDKAELVMALTQSEFFYKTNGIL